MIAAYRFTVYEEKVVDLSSDTRDLTLMPQPVLTLWGSVLRNQMKNANVK